LFVHKTQILYRYQKCFHSFSASYSKPYVLKQGDTITTDFQLPSEYDIWKVQENQVWLKLNWTHQELVYAADDVNLLGDNIHIIKKDIET
jgi:hypothetical protein